MADDTIRELTETVRPYRNQYRQVILGGYSLAGLFALYACTKTDLFDSCLSASGSLWYPGWISYLQEHPVQCRKVYLSLGDTEKNTRSPLMAQVEDNTRICAEMIGKYAEVTMEMNPGSHFNDPSGRIVKGIRSLTA
jgi:predicted alpha/beta superfamily hydrolase